ncbi:SPFH domain-containing protein, partial [Acidisphaera rubrifaciens]|uniref:SPFH domain-containing protein n=1 Tax=Acidisphaera rubrifaciens TaxID=50715 RepID=UPI0006626A0B
MTRAAVRPGDDVAAGPVVQALTIGMRAVWLATALLALAWLASGIRQVPADRSAVVYRFGRIVRVAPPGLLLAWPSPVERVELIPGPERQISLHVSPVPRAEGLDDAVDRAEHAPPQGNAGSYLTGDGGVVLLDAAMTFRINDPVAFALQQLHIPAALDRLFRDAAVTVAARHRLDDFLVTEAGSAARPDAAAARQAVRDELAAVMNARLAALAASGGALGIETVRIDLTATLPPPAKRAYDAVLSATQGADQALARARTDAERIRQQAARERD